MISSRLKNKANKSKNPIDFAKFKRQRNLVTNLNKEAKLQYFEKLSVDCNSKPVWKACKPYFSNKNGNIQENIMLLENDILLSKQKDVASTLSYTKVCNHPQPSTNIHNHPQPSTTIHNHQQPPTTIHNHPQPPTKPPTTTQKLPKKAKTFLIQLFYGTLDVNTETDVDFASDMKQWYIHVCVSVCICFISHCIYYFLVRLIV